MDKVEHKFEDGSNEGIWVGGHPLIINGYGVFGKDAEAITALIQEANQNGFYAGCGIAGIELYAVPDLYKKYQTELDKQIKDKGGSE